MLSLFLMSCFSCFLFLTLNPSLFVASLPFEYKPKKTLSSLFLPLILIKRSNWRREQTRSLCISCPIILCFYFLIWGKKNINRGVLCWVEPDLEKREGKEWRVCLSLMESCSCGERNRKERQEPLHSLQSSSSSSSSQRVWSLQDLRHSSVSQSN